MTRFYKYAAPTVLARQIEVEAGILACRRAVALRARRKKPHG